MDVNFEKTRVKVQRNPAHFTMKHDDRKLNIMVTFESALAGRRFNVYADGVKQSEVYDDGEIVLCEYSDLDRADVITQYAQKWLEKSI